MAARSQSAVSSAGGFVQYALAVSIPDQKVGGSFMHRATPFQTGRVLGEFAIATLWLISLAGPARAADQAFDVTVSANSSQVMAGSKPIGEILKGTRLTVRRTNDDWYLVDVPAANPPQQGWIRKSDVQRAVASQAAVSHVLEQSQTRLKDRDSLFQQSLKLRDAGKLEEAIAADEQTLAIDREVLGNEHDDTLASLSDQADLRQQKGDYAGARKLLEEVVDTKTRLLGKNAWQVTDARLALADTSIWEKLEPADRQALNHCVDLTNTVGQLMDQGKGRAALPLAKESLDIRTRVLGPKHRLTSFACAWMASINSQIGDFAEAERWHLQTLGIQKEVFGERHPSYLSSLNNLAVSYAKHGEYSKCEPLYRQILAARKEVLGEKDPAYADSLNNLAMHYWETGAYAKAEPLYQQALATEKAVRGEKDLVYATCMENLARLYADMGNYAKAEPLYLQALAIRKELTGEKHPDYATTLGNLADLYRKTGKYAQAEPLYRQALEVKKESLGETHPEYAICLNNMANFYFGMGKYAQVEPLLLQALAVEKKVMGEKHPKYASTLANLATVYDRLGEYSKAEPLHRQSLAIRKEVLGEKHPDYAFGLNGMAGHYDETGEYAKAEALYREALIYS